MERFARLYTRLDATTKTSRKVALLAEYFSEAEPEDAAWAVFFLRGDRPKRLLPGKLLRHWAREVSGVPRWLFGECYDVVGDQAETISLVLPPPAADRPDRPLSWWVEERLLRLRNAPEERQREIVLEAWTQLSRDARFLWNKMFTGALRVGVSRKLVVKGLARASGVEEAAVAHRLMGDWTPSADNFRALLDPDGSDVSRSRPYPFRLAHPLEADPETLGSPADWLMEWKWDGIRAQLIRRAGQTFLWTRGEEIVTDRYPEVAEGARLLPDGTVLDGELLAWTDHGVLPFDQLQRRIGRKTVGRKLLAEVPVRFCAFDLLEDDGRDLRQEPLRTRRSRLEALLQGSPAVPNLFASPIAPARTWADAAEMRATSRDRQVEGLMLKQLDSAYGVGRQRGDWWKWKIDPYSVDAVLIYAQRGSGRRASLYTDYTFAVWEDGRLVPFAKAYSGLTDAEIRQVDRFVRSHTTDRFGPVRAVEPTLVFEIAFEGIRRSTRHKSGLAVRFPRMHRWRRDKRPEDADTLDALRDLLP